MLFIRKVIMLLLAGGVLASCASSKKVVYLQDVDVNKRIKTACEYKTVIHTDDLLSIIVSLLWVYINPPSGKQDYMQFQFP